MVKAKVAGVHDVSVSFILSVHNQTENEARASSLPTGFADAISSFKPRQRVGRGASLVSAESGAWRGWQCLVSGNVYFRQRSLDRSGLSGQKHFTSMSYK